MKLPALIRYSNKFIAITVAVILALFSLSNLSEIVHAGSFSLASLTISDSRAGKTAVTYTIDLTPANTDASIKQLDIRFCTTATGACTGPTAMDTGTPTLDSDTVNGTGTRTVTKIAAAANTARIVIETPAAQDDAFQLVFTGLTNTTTENSSIYARIQSYSDTGTTLIDEATIASGILTTTSIHVSAEVGPTFTFAVAPKTTETVNGENITITDTTADQIPFGVLEDGTAKVAAHNVTVTTNANSGFQVTVKADSTPPLNDGDNNIDTFSGSNADPDAWSSPTSSTKNVNTGFFGYTTSDTTLAAASSRFDGNLWAGTSTTAEEIIYNGAATVQSGVTETVGWKAEVNEYQPPGSYTGDVVLVATPTY